MKIRAITTVRNTNNTTAINKKNNSKNKTNKQQHIQYPNIPSQAYVGYVNFKSIKPEYEINLSNEELKSRVNTLGTYKMLDTKSLAYRSLADNDQKALKHLVKAASILDWVYLRQDNEHNIPFYYHLLTETANYNENAKLALELFEAQKGINAKDNNGQNVSIAKNHPATLGRGFYPEDLNKEEFHNILLKMLNDGQTNEVKKILNQRSIVEREGDALKATDYTEYFQEEFLVAAEELKKAAALCTNEEFAKYLELQAQALTMNNPQLDAYADIAWAKLQDTPLEFTITRESYDDKLTPTVLENPTLKELLDKHKITPTSKDNIGVRVGIVNKLGTEYILQMKEALPLLAEHMPFKNEYTQNISTKNNKQTMIDADIVAMMGQIGAYRGGISLASNLPNNDKLALQQGGGHRNVYHIQTRQAKYSSNIQEKLNKILDKTFHKYYDVDTLHDFTILHENLHSLGPKDGSEKLGSYKHVLEENKADMGAIAMLDILTKNGLYSPFKQRKLITSFIASYVLKGPNFESAHRKRNIMQYNYFIQNGGITFNDDGKMIIDFDKITELSKKSLKEIVRLQLDGDINKAKAYVDKYAVWTEDLQKLADKIKSADTITNNKIIMPLAEAILSKDI